MSRPRPVISDKPVRVNLWTFEERLRKIRDLFGLILSDIDTALEQIRIDRERDHDPRS